MHEALLIPLSDTLSPMGKGTSWSNDTTPWAEGQREVSTAHCRTRGSVHFGCSGELPRGLHTTSLWPPNLLHMDHHL